MSPRLTWEPQEGPQTALIECPAEEVFFGGARGGGKTDGVLGKWAIKEQKYGEHFNAMMFRKTTVASEDAIERARQLYVPLGAKFYSQPPRFRMPNGGRVGFGYLDRRADAEGQQGKNLTDTWIEEVGQYASPALPDMMFGAMRSAAGIPIQQIRTGNPGGRGQQWIRQRYGLHPFPLFPKLIHYNLPNGEHHTAAVIPSRITDNKKLLDADPGYINRLYLVGNKELVRAWLQGDWSAIEGAFFDGWTEAMVLRRQKIPDHWMRFRSMDWGSAHPYSVGWWTVVSDDWLHSDGQIIPRGALIRYREWYGNAINEALERRDQEFNYQSDPNVGRKWDIEKVARGILAREAQDEKITYGVADPSMWAESGGPSLAERMLKTTDGVRYCANWRRADNRRVGVKGHMGGWDQMAARMRGQIDAYGRQVPMLYCFDNCKDSIRTIPLLQHDEKHIEDVDTESEDHAADEWRYACMSRPFAVKTKPVKPVVDQSTPTLDDLLREHDLIEKRRRRRV